MQETDEQTIQVNLFLLMAMVIVPIHEKKKVHAQVLNFKLALCTWS